MTSNPVLPMIRYLRFTISVKVLETLHDRSSPKKIKKCKQA